MLISKLIYNIYKKGNFKKFDNTTLSFDFTIKECLDTYISQDIENVGLKSWYEYIYINFKLGIKIHI